MLFKKCPFCIAFSLMLGVSTASVFSLLSYAMAQSDIPEGGLSIGGRAAFYESEDAEDGDFFGGAQLRLYLSQAIGLEGSVDYRRTKLNSTRIDTFPVQASLLAYLFPRTHFNPFVLGGAGWYYTHVEGPGGFDDTQQRFGVHAGAGLQFFLNKFWSIDGTYRFIWLEEVASRDASLLDKDFDDSGHMITVALNLHL